MICLHQAIVESDAHIPQHLVPELLLLAVLEPIADKPTQLRNQRHLLLKVLLSQLCDPTADFVSRWVGAKENKHFGRVDYAAISHLEAHWTVAANHTRRQILDVTACEKNDLKAAAAVQRLQQPLQHVSGGSPLTRILPATSLPA